MVGGMANTKEIEYLGRVERYEIVDGYLEMFVGYVHRAESPTERDAREARVLAYWQNRLLGPFRDSL